MHGLPQSGHLGVDLVLVGLLQLIAAVFDEFLCGIAEIFSIILGVHFLAALFILFGILLSRFHSLINIFFAHIGAGRDGDMLLSAGAQILGGYIGIDIKGHLNLRDTAGSGSDSIQLKEAKLLVVPGKFTFTLQDVDLNLRLSVGCS